MPSPSSLSDDAKDLVLLPGKNGEEIVNFRISDYWTDKVSGNKGFTLKAAIRASNGKVHGPFKFNIPTGYSFLKPEYDPDLGYWILNDKEDFYSPI